MPCHAAGDPLPECKPTHRVAEQLPDARRFHPDIGPNEPQARRPLLEDGPRAVRPDHLVVAHVDDEQVRLMGGAVAGNLQRHVRVDRRHGRIDDLELHVRIALPQHDFENPAEAERRVRHALRRRTPENEDADRAGGLGGDEARLRLAGKGAREEPPSKPRIGRVGPVGIGTDEERRRITVAPQPQPGFQHGEEQHGRKNHRRQAEQPLAPSAERRPRTPGTRRRRLRGRRARSRRFVLLSPLRRHAEIPQNELRSIRKRDDNVRPPMQRRDTWRGPKNGIRRNLSSRKTPKKRGFQVRQRSAPS